MGFTDTGLLPLKAASAMAQWVPVGPAAAGSQLSETVIPLADTTVLPLGINTATIPTYGGAAAVAIKGQQAYGIAAASLGMGAQVAIASTNGALGPVVASGIPAIASGVPAAVAAVAARFAVGRALKNAATGDYFPILVDPAQVI